MTVYIAHRLGVHFGICLVKATDVPSWLTWYKRESRKTLSGIKALKTDIISQLICEINTSGTSEG